MWKSRYFRDFVSVYSICLLLGTIREWWRWLKKNTTNVFYGESKNSWNLKQVKEYPTDYMTGCRFSFHIPKVEQSISLPCIAIRPTFFYIICNNYASHKIFVKLLLCRWTTGHHQNVISISVFQWTLKDGSIQSDLVFIIVQLQEEVGPDDCQWSLTQNTYEIMQLGCCIQKSGRESPHLSSHCMHPDEFHYVVV